jgi:MFS family permease
MMLLSPVSARLILARGDRSTLVAACLLVAAGYVLPLVWHQQPWQLMVASMVMCAGLAFGCGAMPILIMTAVPVTETAAANGVIALLRSLGLAVAGAVVTASWSPPSWPPRPGSRRKRRTPPWPASGSPTP